MIRLFVVSAYFSFKGLFRWLQPEQYLLQKILFPLVQLSFFTLVGVYGGSQPPAFYLIGNALVVAFRPMFAVTTAIADERAQGTLPYLLASPANRAVLFFGRAALQVFDGLLDIALAFAFAVFIFGLDLSGANWPGLVAAALMASLAGCAVGLVLGSAAYLFLDALFLANAMMFAMLLLTGANVPLDRLPGAVAAIGLALPLTRTIEAGRLYAAGAPFAEGLAPLAGDLAVIVAWSLAGYALFSWIETQARRRGTFEGF